MKTRNFVKWIGIVVALLSLTIGTGYAQEPGPQEAGLRDITGAEAYISPTISYQGRLTESDSAVTGTRSMTFRLYNVSSGGTAIWTEGPKDVDVADGLFQVTLGDTTALNPGYFDQGLWLEIDVGGTVLPRQKLQGAPYALSLAPKADVTGNVGSGGSVLDVSNVGDGTALHASSANGIGVSGVSASNYGVYAESNGVGLAGVALYAKSLNAGGIALLAYNDSATSADATLVVSNAGTGNLLKGFGSDGGEDEFRINNNGTFETKADSYIFVPGSIAVLAASPSGATLEYYGAGDVLVNPSTTGTKYIIFGVVLPGVLYGQPVEIKEVTVYYQTSNSGSYISRTRVERQKATEYSYYLLADDLTSRNSTTYTSYTVTPTDYNVLSADEGILSVQLGLYFTDVTHSITIGGIRIRLGHHELY